MNNQKPSKNTDFDPLFFPKNITIVGASGKPKMGDFFVGPLSKSGYPKEKMFLVNPKYVGQEINGFTFYPSLKAIAEELDLVISCIKAELVPDLVREAVERNVKFVLIFTSGFNELLTQEGLNLTDTVLEIVKGTDTRLIGPNCIGPLCPKSRVTYNALASMKSGNIAFGSQSGGHAMILAEVQEHKFLYFSKGLSFGNQIDVNCLEILDYYSKDPDTEVIGMYLESTGSANGNEFFQKMREVTPNKPVIIWKGGQSKAGERAAASHTGAIASPLSVWKNAIKQAGGVFVEESGQFWDVLYAFSKMVNTKYPRGDSAAVIVPGGGSSVEITDIMTKEGLQLNELTDATQQKLRLLYPDVNTSVRNPIDTGIAAADPNVLIKTAKILDQDENIDIVFLYMAAHWLNMYAGALGETFIASLGRSFGRIFRKMSSLFVIINPILVVDEGVARISTKFREALNETNVLCFSGVKNAANTLRKILDYTKFHNK